MNTVNVSITGPRQSGKTLVAGLLQKALTDAGLKNIHSSMLSNASSKCDLCGTTRLVLHTWPGSSALFCQPCIGSFEIAAAHDALQDEDGLLTKQEPVKKGTLTVTETNAVPRFLYEVTLSVVAEARVMLVAKDETDLKEKIKAREEEFSSAKFSHKVMKDKEGKVVKTPLNANWSV
jgi:hypothetical protein